MPKPYPKEFRQNVVEVAIGACVIFGTN